MLLEGIVSGQPRHTRVFRDYYTGMTRRANIAQMSRKPASNGLQFPAIYEVCAAASHFAFLAG